MTPSNDAMDQEATVLAHDAPRKLLPISELDITPKQAKRCAMALVKGSGLHFSDEVHQLLRQRLRIACSIAFVSFAIFLVYIWLHGGAPDGPDAFDRALQISVVAILGFLCALFWTNYSLSHGTLRVLELVMFGSMAVYFADLQFRVSNPSKIAHWATAIDPN